MSLIFVYVCLQIGRLDGVILLDWLDITLERQIEYGSKEGQIDLDMAKLELRNFRKNVIPGAEYFDYKRLLYVVRKQNIISVLSLL